MTCFSPFFSLPSLNNMLFKQWQLLVIYKYMDKRHKIHLSVIIGYTLLVPGSIPFCPKNCLISSWCRFNNFLETFLRDFGLLTRQHHTVILSAAHTRCQSPVPPHPKVGALTEIEIQWLCRLFEYRELTAMQETNLRLHATRRSHQKMGTDGSMLSCSKFWSNHPNVAAEIKTLHSLLTL